jgi:hypothetical protein
MSALCDRPPAGPMTSRLFEPLTAITLDVARREINGAGLTPVAVIEKFTRVRHSAVEVPGWIVRCGRGAWWAGAPEVPTSHV